MKWLVENGCPADKNSRILKEAATFGSLPNMKWLLENGCCIDDCEIFNVALAEHGSLRNLKWQTLERMSDRPFISNIRLVRRCRTVVGKRYKMVVH